MTQEEIAIWVQVAAVIAAVVASLVALGISALDRRNARRIAAKDRAAALRQSKLMFELDVLLRLSANLRRGGSTDPETRSELGGEAAALTGVIGSKRLPMSYGDRVGKTDDELRAFLADETNQDWLRKGVEAQLAMNAVMSELNAELERKD